MVVGNEIYGTSSSKRKHVTLIVRNPFTTVFFFPRSETRRPCTPASRICQAMISVPSRGRMVEAGESDTGDLRISSIRVRKIEIGMGKTVQTKSTIKTSQKSSNREKIPCIYIAQSKK